MGHYKVSIYFLKEKEKKRLHWIVVLGDLGPVNVRRGLLEKNYIMKMIPLICFVNHVYKGYRKIIFRMFF